MKYIEGVYATDDVSRYNTRFTQSALASTLWKIAGVGVPMHINHDLTRPVGWNLLRAVYFEPNWTRVSGVALHPETDQEKVDLQDRVIAYRVAAIAEQSENVQALEN